MSKLIGIEIGGTKLQIVVGSCGAKPHSVRIEERFRFTVSLEDGALGIREKIEQTLCALSAQNNIAAIGVGFGGPVDWNTGKIACSHHVEGWSEFPLSDWLRSICDVPVIIDNDANVAAFGEALHGAGVGFNSAFYVTMGSGVGGGLVVNGKIYHGAKPGESEIGHVRLDKSGRMLEDSCSGWAVDRKIRAAISANSKSALAKLVGDTRQNEAKFLSAALQANDPDAQKILNETAEDLAFGLSHMVHLFHPEIIILGGGLSFVGEPLRTAVVKHLNRFVMKAFSPRPEIALAKLGEDAVPMGALAMAMPNQI